MDVVEGLPGEFALLRRELARTTDRRFARSLVHPLEAVLGLMCGQISLSAIYRFGDTHPELLAGLGLRRSPSVATLSRLLRMVKVSEVRQAMLSFTVALSELRGVGLLWPQGTARPCAGSGRTESNCGYGMFSADRGPWHWTGCASADIWKIPGLPRNGWSRFRAALRGCGY